MNTPTDQELEDFAREFLRERLAWIDESNIDYYANEEKSLTFEAIVVGAKFERERMAGVLEMVESVIYNVHSEFCWHQDRDQLPAWAKDLMNGTSEALAKLREVRK